jgi:hypothetical protein
MVDPYLCRRESKEPVMFRSAQLVGDRRYLLSSRRTPSQPSGGGAPCCSAKRSA